MKNLFIKEPLAWVALVITLVLHFVPGYTELAEMFRPKENETITLNCTDPDRDEIATYTSKPDYEDKTHNHLTFPVTCRLFNNTPEPISVVKFGPALISDRRSYAMLFGDAKGGITPSIGDVMDPNIVKGNPSVPLLLRPKEVWEFESLFAVPYVDITLHDEDTCIEPTQENLASWSGYVCLSDEKTPFTNFLYTPLSVGFWDWNEYGQVVELGDGREVYHSEEKFIYIANCKNEDPETTAIPICKKSPRYVAPSTWTVK